MKVIARSPGQAKNPHIIAPCTANTLKQPRPVGVWEAKKRQGWKSEASSFCTESARPRTTDTNNKTLHAVRGHSETEKTLKHTTSSDKQRTQNDNVPRVPHRCPSSMICPRRRTICSATTSSGVGCDSRRASSSTSRWHLSQAHRKPHPSSKTRRCLRSSRHVTHKQTKNDVFVSANKPRIQR